MFFEKEIDVKDIDAMRKFLSQHPRYYTMNSWNRLTSYAQNVKLYNLGLSSEQLDKAYDLILANDTFEFDVMVRDCIRQFETDTGYTAGFNGRSGGYLVMYDTMLKPTGLSAIMSSVDADADFDEWEEDDLREQVELVRRFDRLCDEIRNTLLYAIEHAVVETAVVTKTYNVTRVRMSEDDA